MITGPVLTIDFLKSFTLAKFFKCIKLTDLKLIVTRTSYLHTFLSLLASIQMSLGQWSLLFIVSGHRVRSEPWIFFIVFNQWTKKVACSGIGTETGRRGFVAQHEGSLYPTVNLDRLNRLIDLYLNVLQFKIVSQYQPSSIMGSSTISLKT